MNGVWLKRLRKTAKSLLCVSAACLSVSGILFAAGDSTGGQALLGASLMTGLCCVVAIGAIAFPVKQ